MKSTVIISFAVGVAALLLPYFASPREVTESPDTNAVKPQESAPPSDAAETPQLFYDGGDSRIKVDVLMDGDVVQLAMDEYLTGVVAAEMPAAFHGEALKAQAVAARTYTLYRMFVSPTATHPEADVCTDHTCCKAYRSEDELREQWGAEFSAYMTKISAAVSDTDGQCIVYDGEPVLAAFHSSSAGMTASSQEVWGGELPYLVSVYSPEDESAVPNFVYQVSVSHSEFAEVICNAYPEADLSGDAAMWITDAEITDSGRLSAVTVGGVVIPGTELRSLLSLRATAVEVTVDDENVVFTTTGYGHGVGMSQYGANAMASEGEKYKNILLHYYPGTSLDDAEAVIANMAQ